MSIPIRFTVVSWSDVEGFGEVSDAQKYTYRVERADLDSTCGGKLYPAEIVSGRVAGWTHIKEVFVEESQSRAVARPASTQEIVAAKVDDVASRLIASMWNEGLTTQMIHAVLYRASELLEKQN